MEAVATAIISIAAATWVGAIVFQSAVVAPVVFTCLEEAQSRALLRALFPRFFRLGLICGAFMLGSAMLLLVVYGASPLLLALALATLVMLVLAGTSLALVPRINAARDAGEAGRATFRRLHKGTVLFTIGDLLLGISILAISSTNSLVPAGG